MKNLNRSERRHDEKSDYLPGNEVDVLLTVGKRG